MTSEELIRFRAHLCVVHLRQIPDDVDDLCRVLGELPLADDLHDGEAGDRVRCRPGAIPLVKRLPTSLDGVMDVPRAPVPASAEPIRN
jgi:hypothetical protein